jgi:hypothetical protein
MKVLFYTINSLDNVPNLGAELDLMQTHLDAGDEVYVLRCTGQLSYCNVNPNHWRSKCHLCQESLSRGLKALKPGRFNQRLPEIVDFAQLLNGEILDYSRLPSEFENLDALLAFELDGISFGAAVASSVVSKTKEHKLDTARYRQEIYNSLKSSYLVYKLAQEALERFQPNRVYFFNGRLAECRPFLQVCETRKITYFCIERAGDFGRYTLFENTMAIDLAYIKNEIRRLWDQSQESEEQKRKIGAFWFEAKRQGILTGDKYYGQVQQKNLLPEGFDGKRRNIVIFTTSEYEFAGMAEWRNPLYQDQNDGILRIANALQDERHTDCYLWVRVHPNLINRQCTQLNELKTIQAMNLTRFRIIWPDSPVNSYELMEQSTVTLTFGSTLGVEATYWKKPSILAGRGVYEDLECSYRPRNQEELIQMLSGDLPAKPQENAIRYGYRMMRNGMPYHYFKQTGYYKGEFNGEAFHNLAGGWWGQAYYFGLRKLDKFKARWHGSKARSLTTS